jgi:hypothetical protein
MLFRSIPRRFFVKKEGIGFVVLDGISYAGVIFIFFWIIAIFSGTHCAIAINSKWAAVIAAITVGSAFTSEFIRWYKKEQRIRRMKKGYRAFVKNY